MAKAGKNKGLDARKARLAEALRRNLKRRKDQSRERVGMEKAPAGGSGDGDGDGEAGRPKDRS